MARKNILNRAVEATELQHDCIETPPVATVTVKALGWVGEDGITYKPGDTFQTSPERAAALAGNVEILAANR
jgi:hypothetical protein